MPVRPELRSRFDFARRERVQSKGNDRLGAVSSLWSPVSRRSAGCARAASLRALSGFALAAADRVFQLARVDGLDEVVVEPRLVGEIAVLLLAVARERDEHEVRVAGFFPQLPGELVAAQPEIGRA